MNLLEVLVDFMYMLIWSLRDILEFFLKERELFGVSFSLIEFMFGAGLTVLLGVVLAKSFLN